MSRMPKGIAVKKVGNIEFALVPVSQYVELLETKRLWETTGPERLRIERPSRSAIDRNPALAKFFASRLNKMELAEAKQACAAEFGENVAPSISAIQRYWHRLRVEQALDKAAAN